DRDNFATESFGQADRYRRFANRSGTGQEEGRNSLRHGRSLRAGWSWHLVVMNINTMTFAARDFSARRGASDEHIPQWICKERATKSGRKRTAARRVAPNLACGCVARRLQTHGGVCLVPVR